MRLIDADALYEKTAEWEAQALAEVERYDPEESRDEWRWWSAVLKERTAFLRDIENARTEFLRHLENAPTVLTIETDTRGISNMTEKHQTLAGLATLAGEHKRLSDLAKRIGAEPDAREELDKATAALNAWAIVDRMTDADFAYLLDAAKRREAADT